MLSEFTQICLLEGLEIDQALRVYLDLFTMPGESQQIDRIIQAFAGKYHQDNPSLFNSAEAAYTLSYLLMMLQTDLHNPQVKEKMKLQEYIKIARGINDGQDLPTEYLTNLYNSVLRSPLGIHQADRMKKEQQDQMNNSLTRKQILFE